MKLQGLTPSPSRTPHSPTFGYCGLTHPEFVRRADVGAAYCHSMRGQTIEMQNAVNVVREKGIDTV